jgi:cell shape-determining protein MreC
MDPAAQRRVALQHGICPYYLGQELVRWADVVVGDVVVTSGLDQVYPKGLVVGRVRFVGKGSGLFRDIRVEPSARFDRLEEVLVVRQAKAPLDTPRSVE